MAKSNITMHNQITVERGESPATKAIIWLHGLGADGHDFEALVPELDVHYVHGVRYVFPTAPLRRVTINLGVEMTAWYDIRTAQLFEEVDWQGMSESLEAIHLLIDEQIASGIASDQILLAGFSQGGVIALLAGLSYPDPIAGILALSTYFPAKTDFVPTQSLNLPIFWGHGTQDPICSYAGAEISRAWLQQLGYQIDWHTYEMQHQVCQQEISDISNFLQHFLLDKPLG